MPPKRQPSAQLKTSQTQKQIDDFIGQSELAPGQESNQIRTSLQAKKIEGLKQKYFQQNSTTSVALNLNQVN